MGNDFFFKGVIRRAVVWLWPEVCPFCQRASAHGVCVACAKKAEKLKYRAPRCMLCGRTIRNPNQELCRECEDKVHLFDQGLPLWRHQKPVSTSVYQFKFHNQRTFAAYYADAIVAEHGEQIRRWSVDLLIPIPLHPKRRRKRGYNQAQLLANELGKRLRIPADDTILLRVRATTPQKELGFFDRKRNLAGAFAMMRGDVWKVRGKRVCLVDDIYTTGSTMDAAAEVLREAGAGKIYFLTITAGTD